MEKKSHVQKTTRLQQQKGGSAPKTCSTSGVLVKKICPVCETLFEKIWYPKKGKEPIHCSRVCWKKSLDSSYITHVCLHCGKEFKRAKSKAGDYEKKYCSKQCYHDHPKPKNLVERVCQHCGKKFMVRASVLKFTPASGCSPQCAGHLRLKNTDTERRMREGARAYQLKNKGKPGATKGRPCKESTKELLRQNASREQFMQIRGGNGTGMSKAERMLHSILPKDRKSTRLNSSHTDISRMPSSA